jgi:hypothetical protein
MLDICIVAERHYPSIRKVLLEQILRLEYALDFRFLDSIFPDII